MGRARLARLHGVSTSYEPSPGRRVDVGEETVVAVLAALGVDASTSQAVRAALDAHDHAQGGALLPGTVVVRPGRPLTLPHLPAETALQVHTENGETLEAPVGAGLGRPGDVCEDGRGGLPLGVHTLRAHTPDGRSARAHLVVAPDRIPAPQGRCHGFLVQLYSLLSRRSWGMGDLGDLADLASWSGRALGSGFLQLNPLHAAVPGHPTDPSPYRPSSRRFPDPVHLRVEDVPEYAFLTGEARAEADRLLAEGAALRRGVLEEDALIDRDAVWELKRRALELVRAVPLSPGRRAAYCDFLAARGSALEDHATWCALAEVHGSDWREWPEALRDPHSAHTRRARTGLMDRVDFHSRLAWYTDEQLAAAQRAAREGGMGIGLVHDLAVGVHPHGADTWAAREVFAAGMSVGAPPDAFNSRGQDWGLPPWRPDTLDRLGHAPFRELLQSMLRHAGGLRIDHVMGLFRLWWVPEGRPPTQGAYVRYDSEAMLSLLALEAHRAGAVVIGEDLGTVEPGVRETLADRGLLGTSVLWFERDWQAQQQAGAGPDHPDTPAAPTAQPAPGPAPAAEEAPGPAPEPLTAAAARAGEPALLTAAPEAETGADARPASVPRPAGPQRSAPPEEPEGRDTAAAQGDHAPILPPQQWRADCLATVTTHDLPTTAARLTGEHAALRDRLGLLDRPLAQERRAESAETGEWLALLGRLGMLTGGTHEEEAAVRALHRFLVCTPARMVGVWLPDTVGDRRPQNLPGTWDQYPNWRLPISDASGRPVTLEEIVASPRLHALMRELAPLRERPPLAGGTGLRPTDGPAPTVP
ncbi:4-alpha-glucanotransferase [Streptomyces sp. NPDC059740]|uniref:4-alpha-glucanotransferase n=1 Tax=Streptomyces sp. NPDC059740 TaxID=3346926 RepID=UPI00364EE94E